MKKSKFYVSKNALELAEILGLSRADTLEIAVKTELNSKIVEVVKNGVSLMLKSQGSQGHPAPEQRHCSIEIRRTFQRTSCSRY